MLVRLKDVDKELYVETVPTANNSIFLFIILKNIHILNKLDDERC